MDKKSTRWWLRTDSQDVVVKKQAIGALGRSKDPRATAFLQERVK